MMDNRKRCDAGRSAFLCVGERMLCKPDANNVSICSLLIYRKKILGEARIPTVELRGATTCILHYVPKLKSHSNELTVLFLALLAKCSAQKQDFPKEVPLIIYFS